MSVAVPTPAPPASRPGPLSLILRLGLGLLALCIPLAAVWILAALALHAGSPTWLGLVVALLILGGVPFAWDLWAERRWAKKATPTPRVLSRGDRIRLRVLSVSLVVLGASLLVFTRPTVNALASRGDWFMAGAEGSFATDVRAGIVSLAHGLGNTFGATPDVVAPAPDGPTGTTPPPASVPIAPPPGTADPATFKVSWPMPSEPHPALRGLTDTQATSLDAVAAYLKQRIPDAVQRVKAIHDFAVTRLSYATEVLRAGAERPPQDAESVLVARRATCDGYTNLMIALAQRTGDSMVKVLGRSRATGAKLDGFTHAWVAVKLGDRAYLIDPTWDAGSIYGNEFRARYSTAYLFTPPRVFAYDHFPDDPKLTFLDPPPSLDDFIRSPVLSAHFAARGMEMEGVTSSSVQTAGALAFRVKNPNRSWLLVLAMPQGAEGRPFNCLAPSQSELLTVSCQFPTAGAWQIELYANDTEDGRFGSVGYIAVDNRP